MPATLGEAGRRRVHNTLGTVWVLYLAACMLPCIDCGPDLQTGDPGFPDFEKGFPHFGFMLLLFGCGGGNNGVPWSANVVLALGVLSLRAGRIRSALTLGLFASALGLTTWWVRRHDTLMVGYYCWQASLFALALGAARIFCLPADPPSASDTPDALEASEGDPAVPESDSDLVPVHPR